MAIKKTILFILVLTVSSFFCYPLQAQSPEASKAKHGHVMPTPPGTEDKAAFPTMPQPGKKVSLLDGYYFLYGFDKKPKMGTLIIKVEVFTKEGKKDTSFEIKADAGMPSMKGAHETGVRPFTLSQKGDYLLPINLVMPGDWEIRLTFSKGGNVIFRGSHQFGV
jgi:hypothetical protein